MKRSKEIGWGLEGKLPLRRFSLLSHSFLFLLSQSLSPPRLDVCRLKGRTWRNSRENDETSKREREEDIEERWWGSSGARGGTSPAGSSFRRGEKAERRHLSSKADSGEWRCFYQMPSKLSEKPGHYHQRGCRKGRWKGFSGGFKWPPPGGWKRAQEKQLGKCWIHCFLYSTCFSHPAHWICRAWRVS